VKKAKPFDNDNVNNLISKTIVGPLIGDYLGDLIYYIGIRNVLLARGAKPDPEIVEEGADVLDEPGGAEHA
jgi:hypothetical protein